jgi:hypothetical protein
MQKFKILQIKTFFISPDHRGSSPVVNGDHGAQYLVVVVVLSI